MLIPLRSRVITRTLSIILVEECFELLCQSTSGRLCRFVLFAVIKLTIRNVIIVIIIHGLFQDCSPMRCGVMKQRE